MSKKTKYNMIGAAMLLVSGCGGSMTVNRSHSATSESAASPAPRALKLAPAIDVAAASCRVAVSVKVRCTRDGCEYATNWGTGTLIASGRVLTVSHLFDDGMDRLEVFFAGKAYPVRLLKRDPGPDFALLAVEGVAVWPTGYVDVLFEAQPITLCGYGSGQFRKTTGYFKRWTAPVNGRHSFYMNVKNRDGDSGGGAFDADGRLIGVQWGCSNPPDPDGVSVSSGAPLIKFLWGEQ